MHKAKGKIGEVKAAIFALKAKIADGAAITQADLDALLGCLGDDGPIANSGGGPDDGGNGP